MPPFPEGPTSSVTHDSPEKPLHLKNAVAV